MGQAKQRGTLEQRQAIVEQREMELARKRKEHLAKLDQLEKESEKMVEGYIRPMIEHFLENTDKYSLTQRRRSNIMFPS